MMQGQSSLPPPPRPRPPQSFDGGTTKSFKPLPFETLSQADFARPYDGVEQVSFGDVPPMPSFQGGPTTIMSSQPGSFQNGPQSQPPLGSFEGYGPPPSFDQQQQQSYYGEYDELVSPFAEMPPPELFQSMREQQSSSTSSAMKSRQQSDVSIFVR